jgi:hypothetical protein
LTVDDQQRVRLPDAHPRQVFAYENHEGTVTLRPVEAQQPVSANVRLEKRGGYTVLVSDQPISEAAIKEALAEFP